MRVLLSTYDSRGGVEPLLALGAAVAATLLAGAVSREGLRYPREQRS